MEQMTTDKDKLISSLGNEIGILSVQIVNLQLHILDLKELLNKEYIENSNLRKHIINLDSDLKIARDELHKIIPNPTKLKKKT